MTTANEFTGAAETLVAEADKWKRFLNGPATGDDSIVETDSGPVKTIARIISEVPSAQDDRLAAEAAAEQAVGEAVTAMTQAGVAADKALLAATQAAAAGANAAAAAAARDAALIQGGVFVDEPTGRASVGDGQAFKVQGSGNIAAYEYRRISAGVVSTLIATYPSKRAYDAVADRQKLKADMQPGKNLANPNDPDVLLGYYVDSTNGNPTSNASYNATGFIPITAGATYALSVKHQIAWYDASKQYISGSPSADGNKTQAAPAGAAFLRCTVPVSSWATFQVEVGSVGTPYVPYAPTIPPAQLRDGGLTEGKFGPSAIGFRHTKFIQSGRNLFNPADPDVVLGYYIDATNGSLVANAIYNTSGYIPVAGGGQYTVSYKNQLAWFDASKAYISGSFGSDANKTQTAPANAAYLRVMVNTSSWATFQVEAGASQTSYEAFKLAMSGPGGVSIQADPRDASVTIPKATFFQVGKNKFNKDTATIGWYIDATGAQYANASYDVSDFIAVTPGVTYYTPFYRFTCFYDANKAVVPGGASSAGTTFMPPAGAAFVRVTLQHAVLSAYQIEVGTSATAFESYGYVLKQSGGYPIRLDNTPDTDLLAMAVKQYVPYGKEIAVYHENICKNYSSHRGRTGISFAGGKETGPSTKLTPIASQVGATIAGTATLADTDFSTLAAKAFSIVVTDPTKTTPANVLNIGDSYTGRMTWANVINATAAAAGLTFLGNRTSNAATPTVRCEGQGGWSIANYFAVDPSGYLSPFMQPVTAGYLYYGQTSFWIDANSANPSYNAANFDGVKGQFSATTGRKLAPNVGDVMGDGGGYIQWNGSNWVAIPSATFGGFAFSFAKYRQAWGIAAPNIVHVLLGTNDFASAADATFPAAYATYKALYDALIASVKADTPTVKFVVGIPVSSGRQGKWGVLETERRKRAYYLLAKSLNADYGGREAENIHVVDYHSVVDRFYGYDQAPEKPFSDYTGTAGDDQWKSDFVHLGSDGFKQMGIPYMGLIQYLR